MKPTRLYKDISQLLSKQQSRRQLQNLPDYLCDDVALSQQQIEIEMKKNTLRCFCHALLRTVFNLSNERG